ncbi:MAG TPA: ASKHA domain-containing protein [Phototrophicaceae bacterium]|nr:ASKHA domain-containing protein [Phototrophicaceae bacterium]
MNKPFGEIIGAALMSETTHRLILLPSGRKGDVPAGSTILAAARALGVEIEAICNGRLTCGKCQVIPEKGNFPRHGIHSTPDHLTPPGDDERTYAAQFGLDLTQRRLACMARMTGDLLVTVPEESQARKQVIRKDAGELTVEVAPAVRLYYVEVEPASLGSPGDWERLQTALAAAHGLLNLTIDALQLRRLQSALRQKNWAVTVTVWQGREVIRVEPGYVESLYGLAVDVGSTTVAAHLCDLRTGAVLATEAMMNPQVRYGEDLISRISYAMSETQGLARLNRAIIHALNELATKTAQIAGIEVAEITDLVLVGNSLMHHLLLGFDPYELGQLPFALATSAAVDIKARDLGLKAVHPGAMTHLLPCLAGYVGADSVGVLLAEQPYLDDRVTLVVDVGTNAEILLGTRDWMLSASSPTGPAFEGAQISHGQRAAVGAIERVRIDSQTGLVKYKVIGSDRWSDDLAPDATLRPTGICGSGMIEVVAELLAAGLLDQSGRFVPDAPQRSPCVRAVGRVAELVLAPAAATASGQEIIVTQNDIRAVQLAKAALYAGVKLLLQHKGLERVDRIKLAGAFGSYIDPLHAMMIGLIPDCDLQNVTAIGNAAGDGARLALLNVEQRKQAGRAVRTVEYVETASQLIFQDTFVDALALPHAVDTFPHLAKSV